MTIGCRIKQARANGPAGKVARKDLAAAADLAYSALADIENGYSDSTTQLHKVAKRLRVRIEWLETGKGAMEAADDSVAEEGWADIIGVRHWATELSPTSTPRPTSSNFRAEGLRRKRLRADRLAVLYGKGDSMAPTIKNGAAVLFDTSDIEPRDDKIYVISYDGALMAKRLVELGGRWFISSDNGDDPK
jgi:phage repressor protein C with HTH and peptisase S24 domain